MIEVEDNLVHLVVTSPPYWQLKDYGKVNQIGFNHSYEDYINNLNLGWKEYHHVLHSGCRMIINIEDQFAVHHIIGIEFTCSPSIVSSYLYLT